MNKTFENWMVEERGYKASTAKTYASEVRRGLDHHENGKPKGSAVQYKAWLEEADHISEEAVQEEEQEEAVQEPKKSTFVCTVSYEGTRVISVKASSMQDALKLAVNRHIYFCPEDLRVVAITEDY